MPREINEVEIQEPPIKELTRARRRRKRRLLRRFGCSPGCLIFILIFIGIMAALFFLTTGPKTVKEVPEDFPNTIPLYKPQSVQKIIYLSSKRKNRGLEVAAFFPKLILYPISRGLDYQSRKKLNAVAPHIDLKTQIVTAKNFMEFIKTPIGPQSNTSALVWKQLTAKSTFLLDFYRGELERVGYAIDSVHSSPEVSFFTFKSSSAHGWVSVKPSQVEEYGTEEMILIVEYEK
jgi:hypothetical protein